VKIVNLCSSGSCCPVVKIAQDHVEIGEEGNICVLTSEEWETLKIKILSKEIVCSQQNGTIPSVELMDNQSPCSLAALL